MASPAPAELAFFPFGQAEGLPSLRLTPESTADLEVVELLRAAEPYWIGNCWGVWLDGFEWGPRAAEIIDGFESDRGWSSRHIVATLDVRRPSTAIQRCTLVADATAAFADARDDESALAIAEKLHAFNGVTDLVVRLQFAAGPMVLDRLHAAVGPTAGGTVYVSPSAPWLDSIRRSIYHARSPWGLRLRQE